MRTPRTFASPARRALGALALLLTAATAVRAESVTVVNKSDWTLHHFFLSSVESGEWGPDQLGDEVVGTGASFTLQNIPCDTYDVRLVDEDGDECVVPAVDICAGNERWLITNKDLLSCQGD